MHIMGKLMHNKLLLICSAAIVLYLLIVSSVGQSARWDILDHISMADNFENNGQLYPDYNGLSFFGVSVYFPGVSIIAIITKFLVGDYFLLISMQLLAIISICIFFGIQIHIANSFGYNIDKFHFFYFAVIFYFLLEYKWLVYATEFKPDVIAFDLGSLGIIIGINKGGKNIFYLIIGAILVGLGILFKQQYLFFITGLFIYSLISKKKTNIIFSIISGIIMLGILYLIWNNNNAFYWTVTVLKDDGFITINQWLTDHYKVLFIHFVFVAGIVVFNLKRLNTLIPPTGKFLNIWTLPLVFTFLGSILSSIKVGGNVGNTCFGLIVIFPLVYSLLKTIKFNYVLIGALIILISQTYLISFKSFKNYSAVKELQEQVDENITKKNLNILTGSDLYGISRIHKSGNRIDNYWMVGVNQNISINLSLNRALDYKNYDYLIIENFPNNLLLLERSNDYSIVYKNELGIIAKFK